MTQFFAIDTVSGTVAGGSGMDRFTFTYDYAAGGVVLQDLSGSFASGYAGTFVLGGTGLNDVLFTGIENLTFIDNGANGPDLIYTDDGYDSISSGLGDDTLYTGKGIDTVDGGGGNDLWGADKSFAKVAININLNHASSKYLGNGVVSNIEGLDLKTGSGNDHIVGSSTAIMDDNINTGDGNDVIHMWGGGTDTVAGGAGLDKLIYTYSYDDGGVRLQNLTHDHSGGYQGTFDGIAKFDLSFSGIENIVFNDLGNGADIIRTGGGADKLLGGNGSDRLNGAGGADTLSGGNGNDTLNGANGADHLSGGNGQDVIIGGHGNDRMSGGAGYDTFVFADGFGHDTITDFGARNEEKIDLSAVTDITSFADLLHNNHVQLDPGGSGFAEIVDGTSTILLQGVNVHDIGFGLAISGADFIF